jgi:glycosyltransferase involved in cell wall biosynthesis
MQVTLIIPFYRNSAMLVEQVTRWNAYPDYFRFILVDDGSPEPALPIVEKYLSDSTRERTAVYRIGVDVPWNRGGARNLGTKQAETDWIIHVDIDHVLPVACADAFGHWKPSPANWYRFPRFRRGQADETRQKDAIDPKAHYGAIHPHVDSYLCTKAQYWKAGGYLEDFSGCLGGGSPFLKYMEQENGKSRLTPDEIHLEVYTRSVCKDASDNTLSRDKAEFSRRKRMLGANHKGHDPIRFPWTREL